MTNTLTPFTRRVTGAIKAELARRDLSGADLLPVLPLGRNAIYDRLSGKKSWEVEDVAKIADFLGIPISILLGDGVFEAVA